MRHFGKIGAQVGVCLVSVGVGMLVFFFASISSLVLEKYDFAGKLSKAEAMDVVATKGLVPLYSWYQVDHFQPVVVVMAKSSSGVQAKVEVNAFSGVIVKNSFVN